jgi:hypothetical protein
MEYEGSIGLVTIKLKKKNIAVFHVLVTFYGKKTWFERYFIFYQSRAFAVRKNLFYT